MPVTSPEEIDNSLKELLSAMDTGFTVEEINELVSEFQYVGMDARVIAKLLITKCRNSKPPGNTMAALQEDLKMMFVIIASRGTKISKLKGKSSQEAIAKVTDLIKKYTLHEGKPKTSQDITFGRIGATFATDVNRITHQNKIRPPQILMTPNGLEMPSQLWSPFTAAMLKPDLFRKRNDYEVVMRAAAMQSYRFDKKINEKHQGHKTVHEDIQRFMVIQATSDELRVGSSKKTLIDMGMIDANMNVVPAFLAKCEPFSTEHKNQNISETLLESLYAVISV